jgi:UDP-N-acetylglucosamine enolpyruvyl transferase
MSKIIVTGGKKLKGEIGIEGAKNSVLPILAATILNGGENIIKNCPMFKDVEVILDILRTIGCKVKVEDSVAIIDSSAISSTIVPENLATEMRSSIILMGPLLAREGKVTISYPGDCVTLYIFFKLEKCKKIINSILKFNFSVTIHNKYIMI